jgi:hypothetical protein
MMSLMVIPMGTSTSPPCFILPVRANTLVPLLFSVPYFAYSGHRGKQSMGILARVSTLLMLVGLFPQSAFGREGRPATWHSPFTFDGSNQCGFFSTNKSTCTFLDLDVEIEIGMSKMFLPRYPFSRACLMAMLSRFDGQRVFGTAINVTFRCANGVGTNHHSFDDAVRVTFQDGAIHKCTGVTFIGIADHVFWMMVVSGKFPFHSRGKSTTTAATDTAFQYGLNYFVGRMFSLEILRMAA